MFSNIFSKLTTILETVMKQINLIFFLAVTLLFSGIVFGAKAEVASSQTLKKNASLTAGQSLKLNLSAVDLQSSNQRVYLKLKARIHAENVRSGSATAMRITINNVPLKAARLVNKPTFYRFHHEIKVYWFDAGSGWTVPYYPWKGVKLPQKQMHLFVFDVTNLFRPGQSELVIKDIFNALPNSRLELGDIALMIGGHIRRVGSDNTNRPYKSAALAQFRKRASGYQPGAEIALNIKLPYQSHVSSIHPRKNFAQNYRFKLKNNGSMVLRIAGDIYRIQSHFGFAGLGWQPVSPQGKWKTFNVHDQGLHLANRFVKIDRKIIRSASCVEVRDQITNKTNSDLPVGILNAVDVGDLKKLQRFRIAGKMQPHFWANTRPNNATAMTPLAYVANKTSGIGFLLQDDAYRNQGSFLVWGSTLAAGDGQFYLKPHGTYTFVWKIYPVTKPSYFKLLNTIRHDWNFYQKIPGLFGFVYPQSIDKNLKTPGQFRNFFKSTGIDIAGLVPIVYNKDGNYKMLYGNELPSRIKAGAKLPQSFMRSARRAGADSKFVIYTDINLINIEHEPNWLSALKGSIIRDVRGDLVPYRAGWLYCVLPALGTPSAKRLRANIHAYLNKYGFDGLFLDEFDHSRARIDFAHQDGMSAIINKNFKIIRKFGIVSLLTKSFKIKLIHDLSKQNVILFANGFDSTLATGQLPVVHFAEPVQYNDEIVYAAQLGRTPLALNLKYTRGLWQDVQGLLKRGVLMCFYANRLYGDHLLKYIYPITVCEIGPGYVIGKHKIVTLCSGTYTFNRSLPVTVRIFGGKNGTLKKKYVIKRRKQNNTLVKLKLTGDQVALISEPVTK